MSVQISFRPKFVFSYNFRQLFQNSVLDNVKSPREYSNIKLLGLQLQQDIVNIKNSFISHFFKYLYFIR